MVISINTIIDSNVFSDDYQVSLDPMTSKKQNWTWHWPLAEAASDIFHDTNPQGENELPTFAKGSTKLYSYQLCVRFFFFFCASVFSKGNCWWKPLGAGSSISPQRNCEPVKIKSRPQAGSQPNSANRLPLTVFLWEAFDVSRGLLHSQWW